ncbi:MULTISPECIES: fimbrial protein [Lelliottia]|uniref:Fimbrial protein n=1 Tax=Lelliottia wanjuensis TaxID=3050585 RepID=A0AAP4FT63_9ENTR|nr:MULTISPECIES: fimbrial protein [unclassified Lelliottia]MDK9358365.1 fimbrial protein [Lelliottia sp. V106_16]MDK9363591.1 fimbrial protein [Lelliottia sp. V106_12]MDK9376321.1 fimbrial protein [Lelliottia sp. V106_10]MDK9586403.1 fimbrial protein [Lelliottia sp. V86_10]MDK9602996.1 fimbrial protein [Lelliottia sp. V106_5]
MTSSQKLNTLFAATLLALSGSALAAGTSVTGGQVHFNGTVVDAACSVDEDSVDFNVDMGQVRTAKFAGADGKVAPGTAANQKRPFTIKLSDCDTTVSKNAAITFSGNAPAAMPTALDNTAGAGSAVGIGIQLYDNVGKALALGTASPAYALINGENSLVFSADYITTGTTVKPGDVQATATFNVTYS